MNADTAYTVNLIQKGLTLLSNSFGSITNETVVGVAGTNTIIRHWDNFGRSLGYSLVGRVVPNEPNRQSTLSYDPATGRLLSMQVPDSNTQTPQTLKNFTWNYLAGSDLKSLLSYPNGLTASWQYDANNQLLQVCNTTPTNIISKYDYTYDSAGRRINVSKTGTPFEQDDSIAYGYNNRSELTNAVAAIDADYRYAYAFDDIGNRESSSERGTNTTYAANNLNQCTLVGRVVPNAPQEEFTPQFDDDGNQTLIKTETGVCEVQYNGENRPVRWINGDTVISMSYDRMGRRVTKNNQRFIYDGYLQIANFDLQTSNIKLQTFIWDPTEPIVTRPFVWLRGDSVAYYTHDGSKNVSEAVARNGDVVAYYEYAPFGAITLMRDESTGENPWRFSCEYSDDVLGLLHFNYRHYSVNDGRWLSYDRNEDVALMGYLFCKNSPLEIFDYLGLLPVSGASSVHGRGDEGQFDSIASKASDNWTSVKTGNDILEDMKRLSKSGNCIEKYTIAGHGWAHKDGEGRALGPGIPGEGEDTGFYTEKRKGAGSVGIPELKKAVGDGSICFCKKCKIQIYSCRIAPAFSLMLAKATGCSVVSASSSCSRLESGKWRSAPGSYDEKLQGGYFGFTESTPSGTKEKGMDYEPF